MLPLLLLFLLSVAESNRSTTVVLASLAFVVGVQRRCGTGTPQMVIWCSTGATPMPYYLLHHIP